MNQPSAEERAAQASPQPEAEEDETSVDRVDDERQRAVAEYRAEVTGWVNRRWDVRVFAKIPCDVVRSLQARVEVSHVRRTITSTRILEKSGHAQFDESVQRSLDALVGQQIPAPPSGLEGDARSPILMVFSGRTAPCTGAAP